ncbi:MAG TPA: hypothetical protein VF407_01905 [Polyangiaceae bacterium]
MAHLNVRERRIEAKIAWVGAELDAIAAAFDRLGAGASTVDARAKDALTLAWTAAAHPRFRDCGVKIDLVGLGGSPSDARVKEVLEGADGIVFVASPHATERASDRALLETVNGARSASVPVVVHATDDVVATLAPALPHADGATETLELALTEVLAALETKSANGTTTTNPTADGTPPLLGALKRILIEAVDRHVEALEPRFVAGRDGVYKRIEGALAKLVERTSIGEKQLVALRDRLDALSAGSVAKTDLTAAVTRIQRMREEIGTEVVRALEGQRRADREQLVAATTATTEAITAVGTRITATAKSNDAKTREIEASVETLRAENAETFAKIDTRLETLQGTLESLIEELKKPKKGWFT